MTIQGGLYECAYCGGKVSQLVEVTAEDIQREKKPRLLAWQYACGNCIVKIRSISRLEPQYSVRRGIRDSLIIVPVLTVALFLVEELILLVYRTGLSIVNRSTFYLSAITILIGTGRILAHFRTRYAWTHDFKWSLNSRQNLIAISIIISGIIFSILSMYIV